MVFHVHCQALTQARWSGTISCATRRVAGLIWGANSWRVWLTICPMHLQSVAFGPPMMRRMLTAILWIHQAASHWLLLISWILTSCLQPALAKELLNIFNMRLLFDSWLMTEFQIISCCTAFPLRFNFKSHMSHITCPKTVWSSKFQKLLLDYKIVCICRGIDSGRQSNCFGPHVGIGSWTRSSWQVYWFSGGASHWSGNRASYCNCGALVNRYSGERWCWGIEWIQAPYCDWQWAKVSNGWRFLSCWPIQPQQFRW